MDIETSVIELKRRHAKTWREKSDLFWFFGLCEEVFELAGAMLGLHRGPVEWELTQISTIAMNWLEKRAAQQAVAPDAANAPERSDESPRG